MEPICEEISDACWQLREVHSTCVEVGFIPIDILYEIANVDFETQLTLVHAIPALWRRYHTDFAWRNKFVEQGCDKLYGDRHDEELLKQGCFGVRIRGEFYFHRVDGPVVIGPDTKGYVYNELYHTINMAELKKIIASNGDPRVDIYTSPWEIVVPGMVRYVQMIATYLSIFIGSRNAVIKYGDTTIWMENGGMHRKNEPAMTTLLGFRAWYRNGVLHRDDGPAQISTDTEEWYQNGELHRVGGPAHISTDSKMWYKNGKIHRIGGPAVVGECNGCKKCIRSSGAHNEYWIFDERFSLKQYIKRVSDMRRAGVFE